MLQLCSILYMCMSANCNQFISDRVYVTILRPFEDAVISL